MTDESKTKDVYHVLLFYKFVRIDDPDSVVNAHEEFCRTNNLRGRILLAPEGINGTVSGTAADCMRYEHWLRSDSRFADIVIKSDEVSGHVFRKLFVRKKDEVVTFRIGHDLTPEAPVGRHISPAEWKSLLERGDVLVLDGRTGYEYDLGHFRGALRPPVDSFREFPEWIRANLADKKDKTILTYCTGGIRCEKLTNFLLEEGFNDVGQLDGGIVTYGKDPETRGALWDGLCYVFDERISVPINATEDRRIVGTCYHCGTPTETYVNCANLDCHRQHLVCTSCDISTDRSCSEACRTAPRREQFVRD